MNAHWCDIIDPISGTRSGSMCFCQIGTYHTTDDMTTDEIWAEVGNENLFQLFPDLGPEVA